MAEILFYRLIVTVDDYGRYDARPPMIKSQCFPIREAVSAKDCSSYLEELVKADLIAVYQVDGKPYLQVSKWDNKPRSTESKFPPIADGCIQTYTDVYIPRTSLPGTGTGTGTGTPKPPSGADLRFEQFWKAYPKKVGKDAAQKAFEKRKPDAGLLDSMLTAISAQKNSAAWLKDGGQFIPNPATWLNQGRWQDGVQPTSGADSNSFAWDGAK
jgi:hypothetical protein